MKIEEDPEKWIKKVSKYKLDRGDVNIQAMIKERKAERKEKNKLQKDIVEMETMRNKKEDLKQREIKIETLAEVRNKQEKDRKEMVVKN